MVVLLCSWCAVEIGGQVGVTLTGYVVRGHVAAWYGDTWLRIAQNFAVFIDVNVTSLVV
jgi:hypothetical protein